MRHIKELKTIVEAAKRIVEIQKEGRKFSDWSRFTPVEKKREKLPENSIDALNPLWRKVGVQLKKYFDPKKVSKYIEIAKSNFAFYTGKSYIKWDDIIFSPFVEGIGLSADKVTRHLNTTLEKFGVSRQGSAKEPFAVIRKILNFYTRPENVKHMRG